MPEIIVKQAFRHCVGGAMHPTLFEPADDPRDVDARTAEVAIAEGWAVPFEGEPNGRPSPASGPEAPASSPAAAPASAENTSNTSDKPAKRGRPRKSG